MKRRKKTDEWTETEEDGGHKKRKKRETPLKQKRVTRPRSDVVGISRAVQRGVTTSSPVGEGRQRGVVGIEAWEGEGGGGEER